MEFIEDTVGDAELQEKTELLENDEQNYVIGGGKTTKLLIEFFEKKKEELDAQAEAEEERQKKLTATKEDVTFEYFFNVMDWNTPLLKKIKDKTKLFHFDQFNLPTGSLKSKLGSVDIEGQMKRSVIQPDFEQQHALPSYYISDKTLRAQRRIERAKNKGAQWYNMPAPEVTEEMKNDLQVLKMRSALDPKRFYKKNDMSVLPKYFQVGRIQDSALDHVNERLTKKQRKRTMVDELLADADFQKYNKKKYKEIIDDKRKSEYRTHMRDKRQRNKKEQKINKKKGKVNK